MYTHPKRKLMADMDKTQLLRMRDEENMTYDEIAAAVGCSKTTLCKILGPMSPEQRAERKRAGGRKSCANRWSKSSEGGVHSGAQAAELQAFRSAA
jgi:hypothetical protein